MKVEITLDREKCIGCRVCTSLDYFEMKEYEGTQKSHLNDGSEEDGKMKKVVDVEKEEVGTINGICPVEAIETKEVE